MASSVFLGSVYAALELRKEDWDKGIDGASNSLDKFSSSTDKKLATIASSLKQTGTALTASITLPLVGVAAAGLAAFTSFDTAMRNIQSISKETDAALSAKAENFKKLATIYPQSSTTIAEGFYQIQSSGFAGADAMKVLEASLKAASAGLTTTEVSAKAISAVLNAYSLSADRAGAVSNVLFKAVDVGVFSFSDLANAIGDVLPTAAVMGVSIQEVAGALATMTKQGINVNESVTALNQVLQKMLAPSDDLTAAIQSLGYESGRTMIAKLGLVGAVKALNKEAGGSPEILKAMFTDVRSLKGVLSLARGDAQGFASDVNAMNQASAGAGATQKALAEQSKGVGFQLNITKNIVQNLLQELGKPIGASLSTFFKNLNPTLISLQQTIAGMTPGMKNLIVVIGGIAAAIGPVLFVAGFLIDAFIKIQATAAIIGGAIAGVSFLPLIAGIAAVVAIIGGLVAVGGIVNGVVNHFGGWGAIFNKAQSALAPLESRFVTFGQRVQQILGFDNVNVGDKIGQKLDQAIGIVTIKAQRLRQLLQPALNFAAFGTTNAGDATASFSQAFDGILARVQQFVDLFKPLLDSIKQQFATTAAVVDTQLKPAFDKLFSALQPLIQALGPVIIQFFTGLATVIAGVVAVVLALFTGVVTGIANALPYIVQAITGVINFITGFVQFVTAIINGDFAGAWEAVKVMLKAVYTVFINIFASIIAAISGFVKGVITFFKSLADTLVGHSIIPDMVNDILGWFTTLVSRATSTISDMSGRLINYFKDTWSGIVGEVSQWPKRLYDWGRNIVESFAAGIASMAGRVADAVRSVLDKAKGLVQGHSPPKEGPFRDIDKWGFNIGAAWATGLASGMGNISGLINGGVNIASVTQPVQSITSPTDKGVSSGPTFNFHIGNFVGTETEKRQFAKEMIDAYNNYQLGNGAGITQ